MVQSSVLVTGAGGFIGRHLVRDQLRRGRAVRALDVHVAGLEALEEDCLEVVQGDVGDADVQRMAVKGIDTLFHLASAHLDVTLSESEYRRVNVEAVTSLLDESREAGIRRFVHVSSCGVHGQAGSHASDETAPFDPDVAYERTKLAGETAAVEYHGKHDFPVVVVRPVWVYGPGCGRTERLFHMISKGTFLMIGRGTNRRSAIYISDFVDALELCATREGIDGEVFIVTNDEEVTVAQVVHDIASIAGVSGPRLRMPVWLARIAASVAERVGRGLGLTPPVSRRSLKFFTTDAFFTSAKARRMLGFHPQVPLRAGLERTYRSWAHEPGA